MLTHRALAKAKSAANGLHTPLVVPLAYMPETFMIYPLFEYPWVLKPLVCLWHNFPLSGSISTGLAFGFTAYPLLKLMNGRSRELHALSYGLGFLFLMNLVFQASF